MLYGQAMHVKSRDVDDVKAGHAFVPAERVLQRLVPRMTHMDLPGGIRRSIQKVKILLALDLFLELEIDIFLSPKPQNRRLNLMGIKATWKLQCCLRLCLRFCFWRFFLLRWHATARTLPL